MSQRDLVADLRAAHVEAPSEVRERVRLIAAAAPAPRRRITWRRTLVVVVPVAAAIAATIVFTRPAEHPQVARELHTPAAIDRARAQTHGAAAKAFALPSATGRVQDYDATLSVRVEHAKDVSDGVKRALRIAASLGGYSASVHAETSGSRAVADLKLKIPRRHVQAAMARLSQLGTITDENVSTVDKTASLNATDRQIARLQKQLKTLRADPQSPENTRRILALEQQIVRLQRSEATTRLSAHYATVDLHLETPVVAVTPKHGHGPLHGLGVAFRWIGIGAVYALALGGPVVLLLLLLWLGVRVVRRRRENALLEI
jgi:hypothetical protein